MANKIGDLAAFPRDIGGKRDGMTYRQWLIGQALAGWCACGDCRNPSGAAIETADEVLAQLESERTEE